MLVLSNGNNLKFAAANISAMRRLPSDCFGSANADVRLDGEWSAALWEAFQAGSQPAVAGSKVFLSDGKCLLCDK